MMTFEQLQSLVGTCTDSSGPTIYRKLYGLLKGEKVSIRSWRGWRDLPLLSNDFLLNTPFKDRLFTSINNVDHVRVSSGTSGKPPLFSPRTYLRGMEYRSAYHNFKKPILAFGVPATPHWHEYFQKSLGQRPHVIVFDPKNASASVKLARIAGVDSISLFAFHVPLISEHVVREGIGKNIRFVEICGESCSHHLLNLMRDIFPNATILPFYGSSEVEDSPIGVPCRPITGEKPLAIYHAKGSHYHEIIDPETGGWIAPKVGAEGELVITAFPGEPSAFPLIRYRTGDMVRVTLDRCKKHGAWTFTILGRVSHDFLKIPGGVLRADEAERVIQKLHNRVTDKFEVHRVEELTPSGLKIRVELHVETTNPGVDINILAHDFSRELRVNSERTYADGVKQGLYLPLVCRALPKTKTSGKHRRIVAS